ncbi:hypothetical protein NQZ68_035486, partial [Dissostichus eleginoides]
GTSTSTLTLLLLYMQAQQYEQIHYTQSLQRMGSPPQRTVGKWGEDGGEGRDGGALGGRCPG